MFLSFILLPDLPWKLKVWTILSSLSSPTLNCKSCVVAAAAAERRLSRTFSRRSTSGVRSILTLCTFSTNGTTSKGSAAGKLKSSNRLTQWAMCGCAIPPAQEKKMPSFHLDQTAYAFQSDPGLVLEEKLAAAARRLLPFETMDFAGFAMRMNHGAELA